MTSPRLYLFPAKEAPLVAILRRGPSRVWHVMRWNVDTDEVEHGSWFTGNLYPSLADVSWDGQWMIYNALGRRGDESWSGICRLPRLTTEFYWDNPGDYGGGGYWTRPDRLILDPWPYEVVKLNGTGIRLEKGTEPKFEVPPVKGWRGVEYARRIRDGWMPSIDETETTDEMGHLGLVREWHHQPSPQHPTLVLRKARARHGEIRSSFSLAEDAGFLDDQVCDACWDCYGHLVVSRCGRGFLFDKNRLDFAKPLFEHDFNDLQRPSRGP